MKTSVMVVLVVAVLIAGGFVAVLVRRGEGPISASSSAKSTPAKTAHSEKAESVDAQLTDGLKALCNSARGDIGIAVIHVETGRTALLDAAKPLPLYSVFKLPLAVTLLKDVEENQLSLDKKIKVTPDEESARKGAKGFEDELIFSDGRFTSTAMQIHGFKPGPYRYETEDTDVEWSADKQNDATDMVGWGGRVDGKATSGNFHWQKKDGTSLFFKFSGTKE